MAQEPAAPRSMVSCGAARAMVFPFMDIADLIANPFAGLTPREREQLDQLSRSLTNRENADALGGSANTVKFHLRNLYGRLSVRNRAEAVALGAPRGSPPLNPRGFGTLTTRSGREFPVHRIFDPAQAGVFVSSTPVYCRAHEPTRPSSGALRRRHARHGSAASGTHLRLTPRN